MKKYLLSIAVLLSACVPPTIPPIVLVPAPPPVAPAPAPKPRATLAFQVVNECDGQPIRTAFVSVTDGPTKQVNDDGYLALELEAGAIYQVAFGEPGYQRQARQYELNVNRQFAVRMVPLDGCPKPEPPAKPVDPAPPVPPVVVPPVVVVPPPAPTPPASPLCAMRDADPLGCVRQVAAVYPHLLMTNTYESCLEFTQRVLEVLGPDWGHVGKSAAESQAVPRGFTPIDVRGSDGNLYRITGVSHDAIKHRVTGQVFDLLGNASANSDPNPAIHGPARIQWAEVPPEHWRASNPFVPAVPVR